VDRFTSDPGRVAFQVRKSCASTHNVRWHRGDERHGQRLGKVGPTVLPNDEDAARGLNRTENVRATPPGDPDFYRLYARRNDSESLNRLLEDSLFIGRAHSLGRSRQLVDLLGWALLVNSLTLARHTPSLRLTA
jgi:hypothetical protein